MSVAIGRVMQVRSCCQALIEGLFVHWPSQVETLGEDLKPAVQAPDGWSADHLPGPLPLRSEVKAEMGCDLESKATY